VHDHNAKSATFFAGGPIWCQCYKNFPFIVTLFTKKSLSVWS
jgi:hypothetical protein